MNAAAPWFHFIRPGDAGAVSARCQLCYFYGIACSIVVADPEAARSHPAVCQLSLVSAQLKPAEQEKQPGALRGVFLAPWLLTPTPAIANLFLELLKPLIVTSSCAGDPNVGFRASPMPPFSKFSRRILPLSIPRQANSFFSPRCPSKLVERPAESQ